MALKINLIKIPKGALEIIRVLETAGYEAWLVGGCVRDLILDRMPEDWDIATSARPEAIQDCFGHTVPTGIAHGTVTVLVGGKAYEVTTYRSESTYSDFRRPDQVFFVMDINEDLARRDFTINALAWHPVRGLADPFGGQMDLSARLVRAVGDPNERFREDALRMMRAVRFAAQLDFSVEAATKDAIAVMAPNIIHISGERIRVELDKWLLSEASWRWELLRDSGLMQWVLPEVERCFEIPQNTPWHLDTVGDHILKAAASAPPIRTVRWALLLHDLGKVETRSADEAGVDHFFGHEERSEALAGTILARLRWDNKTRRRILNLVRHHDRDVAPTEKAVRRAVLVIGKDDFPDWLEVRRADLLAQNTKMAGPALAVLNQVRELYEGILSQGQCLSIRQLAVSGKDLLSCGIPQGPEIGRLLGTLLEWVLEAPERNQKEQLLERLEWIRSTEPPAC